MPLELPADSLASVHKIEEHDKPELTENGTELSHLLLSFLLAAKQDEAELRRKVRDHSKLVLFTIPLEWRHKLKLLRIEYTQDVLEEVP